MRVKHLFHVLTSSEYEENVVSRTYCGLVIVSERDTAFTREEVTCKNCLKAMHREDHGGTPHDD